MGGDLGWLQWGRDVSIPEILSSVITAAGSALLQWGRDVSIPEMHGTGASGDHLPGFNGAGMFPSQKFIPIDQGYDFFCRFNGAGMFPSQKWAPTGAGEAETVRFNGAGMFPSQKSSYCSMCPLK